MIPPPGLTLDTGALIALERGDRTMWSLISTSVRGSPRRVTVPSTALAQAWRGTGHPNLARALQGCILEPMSPDLAKLAGTLCGLSRTSDIVDASVVASAAARGDTVVTADPADLGRLAELTPEVRIRAI